MAFWNSIKELPGILRTMVVKEKIDESDSVKTKVVQSPYAKPEDGTNQETIFTTRT